jgi:AcrR family transcriptional regulator
VEGIDMTARPAIDAAAPRSFARILPVQKRSRDRFELILDTAEVLISEKGVDSLKMSDIVERTGVPHGSLYQYFPDRIAVIAMLTLRYRDLSVACVTRALESVADADDLRHAMDRIAVDYYHMFQDNPIMVDLQSAMRSDLVLQGLDEEEGEILSGILAASIQRVEAGVGEMEALRRARLAMQLLAAAIRFAAILPPGEADRTLDLYRLINVIPSLPS